ncbi:hypothetical protein [Stenotrophomonas sp.]|uniref:hypothetical protein n=1 Tax=Stenotrophomonas sp. TaxID=69392 RepID=UPI002D4A0BCE|nr:hypothetical protein [Stenotrophomonas sp.]HYQ22748.1 hypothetical protein [Stenotrophomonas sp.]
MAVSNEKDLGEALKNENETIEIEGDLARKVIRIKATGKVAWAIALGAIAVAVIVALGTGGTATPASAVVGVGAVSILGVSTATSAVAIAIAAGSVGALNSLRRYRITSNTGGRLVLSRK